MERFVILDRPKEELNGGRAAWWLAASITDPLLGRATGRRERKDGATRAGKAK